MQKCPRCNKRISVLYLMNARYMTCPACRAELKFQPLIKYLFVIMMFVCFFGAGWSENSEWPSWVGWFFIILAGCLYVIMCAYTPLQIDKNMYSPRRY